MLSIMFCFMIDNCNFELNYGKLLLHVPMVAHIFIIFLNKDICWTNYTLKIMFI